MIAASRFAEVWVRGREGDALCAPTNGDVGWLVYLRKDGDPGFSSRNQAYAGPPEATVEFVLNNGQRDEYPAAWVLPNETVTRALDFFRQQGRLPPFIQWHNDSGDGTRLGDKSF